MIAATLKPNAARKPSAARIASRPVRASSRGESSTSVSASAPTADERQRLRAETLLKREIAFISNASFRRAAVAAEIMQEATANGVSMSSIVVPSRRKLRIDASEALLSQLCDEPLLTPDEEWRLFRRMNFFRHRANRLRTTLNAAEPCPELMDEIENSLRFADDAMQRIVSANVRLVVSIVKQLAGSRNSFDELLSDGFVGMIRATAKFDYDRGFRFSTYATMVIRRQLYRLLQNEHRDRTRFALGENAILVEHAEPKNDPRLDVAGWKSLNVSLTRMLSALDLREQLIVRARFGFESNGKKQTLQSLASEFGICKERVRQLEQRAMAKLRALAEENGLQKLLDPEYLRLEAP